MMKKLRIPFLFVISLGIIILLYFKLQSEVDVFNNTLVEITVKDGKSDHKDITIDMNMSKQWSDTKGLNKRIKGGQYDGSIINNGKFDFHSWKVEINLSEECNIDSLWNGVYTLEGNKLTLTPMDYNGVVEDKDNQPFGFVALSNDFLEFNSFKVSGYFDKTIKDFGMYWVLRYVSLAWIIAAVSYIAVRITLISYNRRQKRDAKIIIQVIDTFISFIDAKDPYTSGHSQRVAIYTKEIAKRMGLDDDIIRSYFYIALMHDCGKLMIPDSILKKPGKLTKEEREVIESHTSVGSDLLKNITAIAGIQDGALQHHERYDGTGYPNKLKGTDICQVARILAVADAFDAMNSDRCYRDKLPIDKIKEELDTNSGKQFDPEIVPYMLDIINEGIHDKLVKKFK